MSNKILTAASIAMLAISSTAFAGGNVSVTECASEGNVCEIGGGVKELHIGYYGDGTNPQKFVTVPVGNGVKSMVCDRDELGVADEFDADDKLICMHY